MYSEEWRQFQKLSASDGQAWGIYGYSVDIDGDYAAVGKPNLQGQGAVYVLHLVGDTWVEEAILTASDGADDNIFGYALSLKDNFLVVGAFDDNENGIESGSVYVFRRSGSTWTEIEKIIPSDGVEEGEFGASILLTDNNLFVGA